MGACVYVCACMGVWACVSVRVFATGRLLFLKYRELQYMYFISLCTDGEVNCYGTSQSVLVRPWLIQYRGCTDCTILHLDCIP